MICIAVPVAAAAGAGFRGAAWIAGFGAHANCCSTAAVAGGDSAGDAVIGYAAAGSAVLAGHRMTAHKQHQQQQWCVYEHSACSLLRHLHKANNTCQSYSDPS